MPANGCAAVKAARDVPAAGLAALPWVHFTISPIVGFADDRSCVLSSNSQTVRGSVRSEGGRSIALSPPPERPLKASESLLRSRGSISSWRELVVALINIYILGHGSTFGVTGKIIPAPFAPFSGTIASDNVSSVPQKKEEYYHTTIDYTISQRNCHGSLSQLRRRQPRGRRAWLGCGYRHLWQIGL